MRAERRTNNWRPSPSSRGTVTVTLSGAVPFSAMATTTPFSSAAELAEIDGDIVPNAE